MKVKLTTEEGVENFDEVLDAYTNDDHAPTILQIDFKSGGYLVIPWRLVKAYAVQP